VGISLAEAKANVGSRVVYVPELDAGTAPEEGTIVRINRRYVFVLYDGTTTPKATAPHLLNWAGPPRRGGGT
jgi:hypothetical protein